MDRPMDGGVCGWCEVKSGRPGTTGRETNYTRDSLKPVRGGLCRPD